MPGGFEPDVTVRTRGLRVGCIGAGMIMAECHLAAYREAGFPVVAIASRTEANARKVADRWGIPKVHDDARGADRGSRGRDRRHRLPARPAAGADPPCARAAARTGHPRAEAAGADPRRGDRAARRRRRSRQAALGQPEHALRPVDAGAEAAPRPRRARRDRLRPDRHARDPALADLPRGLRPADPRQHERAPPRRAALPVRRPRRDHHGHPHRPAHPLRASDGITVSTLRFPSGVLALSSEDVWHGPRQEGYADDQHIDWRVDGTDGVAKGTIGWPTGAVSTLTYASIRETGGQWVTPDVADRCGSRTPSSA